MAATCASLVVGTTLSCKHWQPDPTTMPGSYGGLDPTIIPNPNRLKVFYMFHLVKQILSDRSTYQTCQLHLHFGRTIKVFFLRDLDQGKLIFKHIPEGKDIFRFP